MRPFEIGKHGPFDLDPRVFFDRLLNNLPSNVLSFSIAICPDEQLLRMASFVRDVVGYGLHLFLHLGGHRFGEQPPRMNALELARLLADKLRVRQVSTHRRHDDITLAPARKVEGEVVVLDCFDAGHVAGGEAVAENVGDGFAHAVLFGHAQDFHAAKKVVAK